MAYNNSILSARCEAIIYSITGIRYNVVFTSCNELAFTDGNKITINNGKHPIFSNVPEKNITFFMFGLFAHEMMHCIKTDFSSLMDLKVDKDYGNNFLHFQNVLEDPAIENFAKYYFSNTLLESIYYVNKILFDSGTSIEEVPDTYSQFETALLQFGWTRQIKTSFTDDEAKKLFFENLDLYLDCINTANNEERLEKQKEFYNKIRYLFKEKKFNDNRSLNVNGLNDNRGTSDERLNNRANNFIKNHDKDIKESQNKDTTDNADNDMNSNNSSTDTSNTYNNNDDKNPENSKEVKGKSSNKDSKTTEKDDNSSNSENDISKDANNSIDSDNNSKNDLFDEEDENQKFEDAMEQLNNMLEETNKKISEENDNTFESNVDFKSDRYEFRNIVKNINIPRNIEYNNICEKHNNTIISLTNSFKRALKREMCNFTKHTSGQLNLNRYLTKSHETCKVFDKRREESDKYDTSILLLIDESGSMSFDHKITIAKEQTVILTEVFTQLNIPVYVMGFSADDSCIGPNHRVYKDWNKKNKTCVANIDYYNNNYDGYSISYAAEIIKKRHSKNKLIIVISDGEPLARNYMGEYAIKDTALAVKNAKNYCNVIGILIGNLDNNSIYNSQKIYGEDFVYCKNPADLVSSLVPKIKKKLEEW